jgi:hypothetical protein
MSNEGVMVKTGALGIRVEAAIKDAPHGRICNLFATSQARLPDGTYQIRAEPCDCWKSRALEVKK